MYNWLKNKSKNFLGKYFQKDQSGDIFFKKISVKEKAPHNNSLEEKEFVEVVYNKKPYWAIFKCPCGCSNIISLSLQDVHHPHWKVSFSKNGLPTIYPSIWQNIGCFSHFWIENGRIIWCHSSGIEPWIADPKHYNRPRK